ncbi:PIN domain protein [Acididesulfobacillus acetoxydans]|uniref:PIN domain protein n=1 Tax=Acididesulfobacillus acetoxydans TaxID=1561005 RepID=A0A8S0WWM7_9FIRM|nr:PhoH family protein [Acididesulfobacillus acetoxydans]CAA7600391.1 PIN domain protein [Acididesulfobacillus acetoxydans]CEJ07913.1 PhoH protein [Acididesulfobacillus acetoxydans]
MEKAYVLDTSVLLHDPKAIFRFEENEVIIPYAVLEEVESTKRSPDSIGQAAREVIRTLDQLRDKGQLADGVPLGGGGKLRIELNHTTEPLLPLLSDPALTDNRILTVCVNLAAERQQPVVLVTKDIAMRVKGDALGVETQDYYNDKVNLPAASEAALSLSLEDAEANRLLAEEKLSWETALPVNACVKGVTTDGHILPLVSSANGTELVYVQEHKRVTWGIFPKNSEQNWALQMLNNPEIRLVSLIGPAGTGKTLLALASGLEQTVQAGVYAGVLCARPIVPFGKDIGYLPGEKEQKVRPYMQPIYDNLEFLLRPKRERERDRDYENGAAVVESAIDLLKRKNQLEIEVLTYIRGRSIPNQFMIIDEAQNLSVHEVKTIITRAGEGTKIVLCGDQEQIDHPYLDKQSNGLAHVASRMQGKPFYAQVYLVQGERSELASWAAELL